jgi:transposase-like protein
MSVLTTGAFDGDAGSVTSSSRSDPEVPAKAKRRVFTAAFKKKVLAEYDAAVEGSKGEVLRRHGVATWHISTWRKAREAGAEQALSMPRGRKPADPRDARIRELEKKNTQLEDRLRKAEKVIDVQGKAAALLQALCESAPETSDSPSSPPK